RRRHPPGQGPRPGQDHRHGALRLWSALSVEDLQPGFPEGTRASHARLDGMSDDPLVSTAWLAQRLGSNLVSVVDATWFMPGEGKTGHDSYAQGHIPGAAFFDIDAIADHATDLPHMLPSDVTFAEAAGALGLRRDLITVGYNG